MAQSEKATVWLGEERITEIDNRRHSTVSRSEWVREAVDARLDAEDAGEWTDPDRALADGSGE